MKQKLCEWVFVNIVPQWFTRYSLTHRFYTWFAVNGYGDTGEGVDFTKDYDDSPF